MIGRIPNDGPDIPRDDLQAPLYEAELFGEMACLYRIPRSATVVADRDWFVLEFYRNILDKMLTNRNRQFKEQMEATYRKRFFELQLRNLALFRELPPDSFARIRDTLRDQIELVDLDTGGVLCDEHERSESMYIIRRGFVKVMKNAGYLLSPNEIADWPPLGAQLAAGEQEPGPKQRVWQLLGDMCRDAVRRLAGGGFESADKLEVVFTLNDILKRPELHKTDEFKEVVQAAGLADQAKGLKAKAVRWEDHRCICSFNRQLLAAAFPGLIPKEPAWLSHQEVLAYRGKGSLIGEMGLFAGEPRIATCIAYDHPSGKCGSVELVRISKAVFDELLQASQELHRRVQKVVENRRRQTAEAQAQPFWENRRPAALTQKFDELGLIQGQKLMLIDLDRCTRCDECVRACVATHAPHPQIGPASRLFLDGPRIGKYLVPATCRMCRDPVCLIECPVGSIHKGERGQIVIEDWCIGCTRCATQCPYEAIQMHDVGVIHRRTPGWRFLPSSSVPAGGRWLDLDFPDRNWSLGCSPFRYTRELGDQLAILGKGQGHAAATNEPVYFRYRFELGPDVVRQFQQFHLQVSSASVAAQVWVNGREVAGRAAGQPLAWTSGKGGEGWHLETMLTLESAEAKAPSIPKAAAAETSPHPILRVGANVLCVAAVPDPNKLGRSVPPAARKGDVLVEVGLFGLRQPVVPQGWSGEFSQELVTNVAVVCDMCSALPTGPACVTACPHDAALRVDAAREFPIAVDG